MNAAPSPIVTRRPLRLLAGAGINLSAALLIVQQLWADQALALS